MTQERAAKTERVAKARRMVESSTLSDTLKSHAILILDSYPTGRQVRVLIALAEKHGGTDETE